jgi:hypothetical protein
MTSSQTFKFIFLKTTFCHLYRCCTERLYYSSLSVVCDAGRHTQNAQMPRDASVAPGQRLNQSFENGHLSASLSDRLKDYNYLRIERKTFGQKR